LVRSIGTTTRSKSSSDPPDLSAASFRVRSSSIAMWAIADALS
jgi:hypothetical protein